ncbi:hypothetical protein [uncultured Lactobacillus sp.]|uniref:hypothetical protein n=1 Tax=uncultured Lactobacillus sp. TaxID=153152 RepID=UPI002590EF99|nr:hypothetical protein [uncultured Lactobacillus sp.]
MIKELIFGDKKYWQNDEKPTPIWISKKLKLSEDITLNQYEDSAFSNISGIGFWLQTPNYVLHEKDLNKVIAQAISSDTKETFVCISGSTNSNDRTVWFKMNDILQNGGISSSPLTHLYQGSRHLLDRKVAYVFD